MAAAPPVTPPRRPERRAAGVGMTPARPRDPALERALQLSTFESNYSVEEFVATLSEKAIDESKANPGPFDPRPFMQTFSPALDSLLALRSQVAERTKRMEAEVRRAEREYGRRLRELDGGFEAIGSSFSNLETKITDVGRTAVRIGEQLESLHQTRSTAQSTSLLVSYYLSLVHQTSTTAGGGDAEDKGAASPTNPLEQLFATRTSRDGRARLAVILRRLMALSKDVADSVSTSLAEAEAQATPVATEPASAAGGSAAASANAGAGAGRQLLGKRRKEKEKADRVRDEIERYCERFEKEVLRLFDRSYRKGDPRMMAHCARTLQDFNGGASCVQIYVNQHDFFISKDKVLEDAEKGVTAGGEESAKRVDIWKTIGDPDAPAPTAEVGMDALFKEIRTTVSQEAQIVKAVFPNPIAVMQVFLQRVFAQIQQHLETLVSRASAISTLAVLRILNLTHSGIASLVEDLKAYDAILSAPGTAAGPSKGPVGGLSGSSGPLTSLLDHSMEEMFVPWLEGNRYLDSESKNLVELYGGLLSRFARYHESVVKAKPNSLLDKVVNQLSNSSSSSNTGTTQSAASAAISKYANLFTSSAASAAASAATAAKNVTHSSGTGPGGAATITSPTTSAAAGGPAGLRSPEQAGKVELQRSATQRGDPAGRKPMGQAEDKPLAEDGLLSAAVAERMLKWHAEAVGRIVELCAPSDVAKTAFALSKVLSESVIRSYVETSLDSALFQFEHQDSKAEPDLSPLQALKPADVICQLWQRYTSTAMVPLASSVQAIRREMATYNQHNVVRMEDKVNAVVQRSIDNVMVWLRYLLQKQKKNDYKPSNDEISFARNTTEPCQACCDYLAYVKERVDEGMSGSNAEAYLTEIGVAFHSLLLDHYKRFPVNPTGGLMLTKDLATYQETLGRFGIPAINDRFDMLRQLGNTFIIGPNVLKSYMTEGHLGKIDARLLRPYLAQRSDYSAFSRSLQLDDGGGGGSALSAADGGGIVGHHTPVVVGYGMFKGNENRLSTMTGVAGAGMGKLKAVLKEFDASGEDLEAARRAQFAAATKARQVGGGSGGAAGSARRPAYAVPPPSVYFHMH